MGDLLFRVAHVRTAPGRNSVSDFEDSECFGSALGTRSKRWLEDRPILWFESYIAKMAFWALARSVGKKVSPFLQITCFSDSPSESERRKNVRGYPLSRP